MNTKLLLLIVLCLGLLTACSTDTILRGTLNGDTAQFVAYLNGSYSFAALNTETREGYRLVTRQTIRGTCNGDIASGVALQYAERYIIVTYQPLSNAEADRLAAAQAFNEAKPDAGWKVSDPLTSKAAGSMTTDDYTLYYNDDNRTFSYEYPDDGTATLTQQDDVFTLVGAFPIEEDS